MVTTNQLLKMMIKNTENNSWENPDVEVKNPAYGIEPLDVQKRLRVWQEQQMPMVLESLKPSNYLTEFVRFIKGCDNLSRCYPNMEELGYISEIRMEFWAKYQYIVKTKIKPMIKAIYKNEIRETLRTMKMYGAF